MIILAIDPGISGALAFYDPEQAGRVAVFDMPILDGNINPHALRHHIHSFKPDTAIIEHVGPHPKEGVRSVWRFAAAFTTACVVVRLEHIPLTLVPPAKWKKAMGLKGGREGKEDARLKAIDNFPLAAHSFHLKKHHGRSEAALLALYHSSQGMLRNADPLRTPLPVSP
jgi:hypothetical protein